MIELMIVIAIIGILATIVISTPNNKSQKSVESAARNLAAAIREVQNYALTGKGAGGCSYQFSFADGASNYSVSGCVNQSYPLGNEVTIGSASANSLIFTVPHANNDVSGSALRVTLVKDLKSYSVCVYSNGNVEEKEGGSC